MQIEKMNLVYFSPTYSTKKVVKKIAEHFNTEINEYDITNLESANQKLHFDSDDMVIVGVPVYAGRVPQTATERLSNISGENTKIVIVVTYGNRHYDDALLELKNIVESKGFQVIAGAAIVTEHSIVKEVGAGRPDKKDLEVIDNFGKQIADWISVINSDVMIPGNPEYKEYQPIPITPYGKRSCTSCGICSRECPVGAIEADKPRKTMKEKCISCMRCIKICPEKARTFSPIKKFMIKHHLKKKCIIRREPEIFV